MITLNCIHSNSTEMDLATIIVLVTALTALMTGIYSIYHSRKTTYINAITTARIKYIENLRNYISEFCGLILTENNSSIKNEKIEILRFTIKLHLNRKNDFDIKVLELLDKLSDKRNVANKSELNSDIMTLTNYLQDIFTLEWDGIKMEAVSGKPSKKKKNIFTNKHKESYGN